MLLLASPESLPDDRALAEVTYKIVAGVSWYGPCDFEKTDLFNHDDRADFRDRCVQPRVEKIPCPSQFQNESSRANGNPKREL